MIASAFASSCRCCSIRTADSSSAVGLAMSRPAMSGAVPCTASNTPTPFSPRLAAGTTPRPPTRPAHRSDTMSPYRFGSSSTSSRSGCITRCMHAASTMRSSNWMSGYCAATLRAHSRNRPSLSFMMLALCTAVTFLRPRRRACSNANSRDPRRRLLGDDLQALDHAGHDRVLEPGVEVLGVLAHDHQVDAGEPRRHRRQVPHRPQVRVEIERLAQPDVDAGEALADRRRDRALRARSCSS